MTTALPLPGAGIFVMLALFTGGGGGGGSASPPHVAAPTPVARFAYVANYDGDTVSIYAVAGKSGQLRARGYVSAGTGQTSVSIDPRGRFAYAVNSRSDYVSAYTIDASSGALTPEPGSPFTAGTSPYAVRTEPSGCFVANGPSFGHGLGCARIA